MERNVKLTKNLADDVINCLKARVAPKSGAPVTEGIYEFLPVDCGTVYRLPESWASAAMGKRPLGVKIAWYLWKLERMAVELCSTPTGPTH